MIGLERVGEVRRADDIAPRRGKQRAEIRVRLVDHPAPRRLILDLLHDRDGVPVDAQQDLAGQPEQQQERSRDADSPGAAAERRPRGRHYRSFIIVGSALELHWIVECSACSAYIRSGQPVASFVLLECLTPPSKRPKCPTVEDLTQATPT
jgi:hypothetical protein